MIAFAITSYRDGELALRSIAALRLVYPESRITHIQDEPRLKLPQFAGRWTERWMRACLLGDLTTLIKLDPDTRCLRRASLPDGDLWGQVAPPHVYWGVEGVLYGGAIGFKREAAQKIVDSGLLLDEKYTVKPYVFERNGEWLSLQDPIVHDVAQRLGLHETPWSEVYMALSGKRLRNIDVTKFAFVHPVTE